MEKKFSVETHSAPKYLVELRGFNKYEVLEIEAPDLFRAYKDLGKKTARLTRDSLSNCQKRENYESSLAQAGESLSQLRKLAQIDTFTTSDGLNHLTRYLESLDGFAQGTGLTQEEVALLQINDGAGCQTLYVTNTKSGEIVAVHTEEDADQYKINENPAAGKRWVKLTLPDQKVEYCSYAGICGYGCASGIIQRDGQTMFQAADSLEPTVTGPIWANAMVFMLMDTGSIEKTNELKEKILNAFPQHPIFQGGYVVHQIESGLPPLTQSLEFGGTILATLASKEISGRSIQYGANYPQDPHLQEIDEYSVSTDKEVKEEKIIMQRRQRRLDLIAKLTGHDNACSIWGEQRALNFIYKIIQKGRGDILDDWFTGLSNDLVAQNVSVYVSSEGNFHLIVRKGYSQHQVKASKVV